MGADNIIPFHREAGASAIFSSTAYKTHLRTIVDLENQALQAWGISLALLGANDPECAIALSAVRANYFEMCRGAADILELAAQDLRTKAAKWKARIA